MVRRSRQTICRLRRLPEVPYVMVSRPDFKPGSEAMRAVIEQAYRTAVAEGDKMSTLWTARHFLVVRTGIAAR